MSNSEQHEPSRNKNREMRSTETDRLKSDVIKALHTLIHDRLFGTARWIPDRDTDAHLSQKLEAFGLDEPVSGSSNGKQSTPLGREIKLELMMVFLGIWDRWEMPMMLEEYDLISEDEVTEIYDRMSREDHEEVLRPIVRRAFLQHVGVGMPRVG